MARQFNGSTEFLRNLNPTIAALPFSVACWFVPPSPAGLIDQVLWHQGDALYSVFFRLVIEGDTPADRGKLRWAVRSTTTTNAQSAGAVTAGAWNHAVGIEITTGQRKVILNGTDIGNNAVVRNGLSAPNTRTCIAAMAGTVPIEFLAGKIGHVAVWAIALTDQEALSLARGASPLNIQRDSLISYWPINGQSPELDIAGPRPMTLSGAPVIVEEPPTLQPYILAGP